MGKERFNAKLRRRIADLKVRAARLVVAIEAINGLKTAERAAMEASDLDSDLENLCQRIEKVEAAEKDEET